MIKFKVIIDLIFSVDVDFCMIISISELWYVALDLIVFESEGEYGSQI